MKKPAPDSNAIHIGNDKIHLTKDLRILNRRHHKISGARLIFAEKTDESDPGYIVAWVAPWQKTIRTYLSSPDKENAQLAYKICAGRQPPYTPELCRDFQRSAVYEWEEDNIDPHCPDNLTPDQMERIVKKVSDDFNIAAPLLIYEEPEDDAQKLENHYNDITNELYIEANTLSFLLHEMAHAIDAKVNRNYWADHGPSFVRTLITLAAHYQFWHDEKELEKSAAKAGLAITPPLTKLQKKISPGAK